MRITPVPFLQDLTYSKSLWHLALWFATLRFCYYDTASNYSRINFSNQPVHLARSSLPTLLNLSGWLFDLRSHALGTLHLGPGAEHASVSLNQQQIRRWAENLPFFSWFSSHPTPATPALSVAGSWVLDKAPHLASATQLCRARFMATSI